MTKSSIQLERLFNQGALALGKLAVLDSPLYACPICSNCFDENELKNRELSLEHVPPASVGGKAIILTCKTCNNTAGHKFESHLSKRQTLTNFTETLLDKKEGLGGRARLNFGDMTVNVSISTEKGKTIISILDKINDPKTTQRLSQTFKTMSVETPQPNLTFNIETNSYSDRKIKLSLLKTAFLAASAKLGYTYALSPVLNLIRHQITNPEELVLKHWLPKLEEVLPKYLLAIDDNSGVVLVVVDGESVLLPWHRHDYAIYAEIMTKLSRNIRVQFKFVPLAWPKSFEAVLDHRTAS